MQRTNIDPRSLIDGDIIAAAQSKLDDATSKLESARKAVAAAEQDISRSWDSAVAEAARGGDALAGHAAHVEAVQRRDFAVRIVAELEKNLTAAYEHFRLEKIRAREPVLRKAREIRLAAARAFDAAIAARAEADALAADGKRLLAVAHAAGLQHFNVNDSGHGARSEAAETSFIQNETENAASFWGRPI